MTAKPDTQATPKNPFNLKEHQRGFLLVPYEEPARERVLALLAEQGLVYETDEERREKKLPKIVFQIKMSKLSAEDVLFSAVPTVAKYGPRKQPVEFALKLSKGVEIKKYIGSGDEDADADQGAVADALQSSIHPFTARIGQDSIFKLFSF